MIVMAALLSLVVLIAFGNNCLQSTTFEVEAERLPDSFDGFCITQVSDIHNHRFGNKQYRLVKAVRESRPDLIVMTGDLTNHGKWNAEYMEGLVRQLRDIAPVYFITGNHDYYARDLPELLSLLEAAGVQILAGTSMDIARDSQSISIAGIQDPDSFGRKEGQPEATMKWKSALEDLRATIEPQKFSLLLSHRPEFFADYERLGFDIVLSGHAHGGQVRLPVVGALYVPDQGWFPPFTSGVHRRGETTLVVSRGLGNSIFPIRVLNRPELVVVRLRRPRS